MASQPANRDLELVLQRFFSLSPPEQLDAYRTIRDFLAARVRETKRDRVIAERAAAVGAMADVAVHLSLPAGEAPTPVQFDRAAHSLALGWDRSRVRRAWGRWRFAKAAFLGHQLPLSAQQRDQRQRRGGRPHAREGHLTGVKLWLASDSEAVSRRSYTEWAREYNDNLPPDGVGVAQSPTTISRSLKATWPDVLRLARGEISSGQARPMQKRNTKEFCHGPHQLVTQQSIQKILGKSTRTVRIAMVRPDFPPPVLAVPASNMWLRDDVAAWKAGRTWTPEEKEQQYDSLRNVYMTFEDVSALTGLNRHASDIGADGLPAPVARVGYRKLWLRSEVEASPAAKRDQSQD